MQEAGAIVSQEPDMTTVHHASFARHWQEIAAGFLQLGSTAYGGPAIMGIMQSEFQEKRQWVTRAQFVEGLSLVNMLPGPGATQLGIFLGYARGGWWGGVLAGLCFMLPAFCIMSVLTLAYAILGVTPLMRSALYGLGPVVLGLFTVAVYRLGQSAVRTCTHVMIALAAAAALLLSPLGMAAILVLAGGVGLLLFHSTRVGVVVLVILAAGLGCLQGAGWSAAVPPAAVSPGTPHVVSVMDLGLFFFTVGALTFGGGLTMVGFIQDQVVHQLHWLTPQEFVDGLALGQCTPGPISMVAVYVGYKVAGVVGAVVGAIAVFLPSFILLLSVLPVLDRVRTLRWAQAAMQGIGPAVIGVLTVLLGHMAPHALPDRYATVMLVATVMALLVWRTNSFKLMLAGAIVGVLRSRLLSLPGMQATLAYSLGIRV